MGQLSSTEHQAHSEPLKSNDQRKISQIVRTLPSLSLSSQPISVNAEKPSSSTLTSGTTATPHYPIPSTRIRSNSLDCFIDSTSNFVEHENDNIFILVGTELFTNDNRPAAIDISNPLCGSPLTPPLFPFSLANSLSPLSTPTSSPDTLADAIHPPPPPINSILASHSEIDDSITPTSFSSPSTHQKERKCKEISIHS